MDEEQIADELAERVRALITDAQKQAQEIVATAEADAERIREDAEGEASRRLAEVRAALTDLQGKLGGGEAEVTPGPVVVPEPAPPDIPEPRPDPVPDPVPTPEPVPEPAPEPPADANGDRSGDKSAARLVAMKMALDGSTREEIEAHLADNYELEHAEKLLDDVMTRAKA
ncbi:MAG: hypothetical protein ACHQCI_00315 [Solirubrobacterales bacterium]|jgi:outer membrane biosynthesis protein TonB